MAGWNWVGSVLNWAGIQSFGTGESGKLSGAPEDAESDKAIRYAGGIDSAGQVVSQKTTLGLPAAWACVRLKSDVAGAMGMGVFEKKDGGRVDRNDYWLYDLVHEEPNRDQTAAEFWSGMYGCIDLWGNGYAEKEMLGTRTTALTPLAPSHTRCRRNRQNEREYVFMDRGKEEILPADKVLHLRGMTLGGDSGLSAVEFGRRTIGGAIATNKAAQSTFNGGLQLSGFMETGSTKLSADQRADLIEIFDAFRGEAMRNKIVPLEKDFKFAPLMMKPQEAQLLESRAWDIEEVCRWFGVPPILIGHAAKGQTMWGSGIEQILLGWQTLQLNPLLRRVEQSVKKQLIPAADRKRIYPEINREALMAADSAARAALYSAFGQNGVMTRGEMRSRENLPSMPGDDMLTVQSNLVPLDQLGKAPTAEHGARSALMNMLFGADIDVDRLKSLLAGNIGGGQPYPEE